MYPALMQRILELEIRYGSRIRELLPLPHSYELSLPVSQTTLDGCIAKIVEEAGGAVSSAELLQLATMQLELRDRLWCLGTREEVEAFLDFAKRQAAVRMGNLQPPSRTVDVKQRPAA
jgi:hypothetical protein